MAVDSSSDNEIISGRHSTATHMNEIDDRLHGQSRQLKRKR